MKTRKQSVRWMLSRLRRLEHEKNPSVLQKLRIAELKTRIIRTHQSRPQPTKEEM